MTLPVKLGKVCGLVRIDGRNLTALSGRVYIVGKLRLRHAEK